MGALEIPVDDELFLKTWELEHAPSLFALVDRNREHLGRWLPWVPFVQQVDDSRKFIRDAQAGWDAQQNLELGIWKEDTLVGCIGLHKLNRLHNKTSFGYWLGEEYQGEGIMTRAVEALVRYCFEVQKFHRVVIRAAVENSASRAIPERLGFVQEGILRDSELVQGKYLDIVVYGKLSSAQ